MLRRRGVVIYCFSLMLCLVLTSSEELWRGDVTSRVNIGVSPKGFNQIRLDCGRFDFQVIVETESTFNGVIYTRGSFYSRKSPCFRDANGGSRFKLKIPYDQCNVEDEGEKYKVTLIVQHDKELIMPGDGAFDLQCDLSTKANQQNLQLTAMSSISLADPDPAGKDIPTHMRSTVSAPNEVVFKPSDIRPRNKTPKKIEL